ncbi:MAG: ribosome-associated protein [Halioglobus sp.]|jgi:ribosome-associated protein
MVDKAAPMKSVQMAHLVEEALDDLKAINVVTMDVSELTDVMDYMVIASGSSSRHVKSLASNVSVELKKKGIHIIGVEGEKTGDWVLVDLGDVVVHVMLPDVRDLYDLERLWTAHSSNRDTRSVQSEELD